MTLFLKVLTHAKNTDNHCWSAVMQYFECMVPKTFYSCFLCLRNEKVINFQIFPTLVQEKCWPQQKNYIWPKMSSFDAGQSESIFVHNLVTIEQKIKKWWGAGSFNSFLANVFFLYLLKTTGNIWCSGFFRGYIKWEHW